MTKFLTPISLGALKLKNSVVMAPLTRARSNSKRVPNDLMVEYYKQRAGMGLIITEATVVSESAAGYANTPGIWNDEQVAGWKKVTDAVHAEGGLIIVQLWHVGRISDPEFLGGNLPVAPSAIKPAGHVSLLRPKREYVTPRELKIDEIKGIVNDFRVAAENAKKAGFDGVELHAANGYLIDQFLQNGSNKRQDEYGGAVENRAKFLLEITDELIAVWGADRVGVHLAPQGDSHDISDTNPLATFSYVGKELGKRKISFIFIREGESEKSLATKIKAEFNGPVIINQGLNRQRALEILEAGLFEATAFGVQSIANPDLAYRLDQNLELNTPVPETFYGEGHKGYTDYPTL